MCDKPVDTSSFAFWSVPKWYKTQNMGDKVVSKQCFIPKNSFDRYKTQEMYDKAIDVCLPAIFVVDQFVKSKILERLDYVLFSNDEVDRDDI